MSIWEISIHFLEASRKSCLKKLHVKTTQHNTTTRSKKQDKSVERKQGRFRELGQAWGHLSVR